MNIIFTCYLLKLTCFSQIADCYFAPCTVWGFCCQLHVIVLNIKYLSIDIDSLHSHCKLLTAPKIGIYPSLFSQMKFIHCQMDGQESHSFFKNVVGISLQLFPLLSTRLPLIWNCCRPLSKNGPEIQSVDFPNLRTQERIQQQAKVLIYNQAVQCLFI